MQKAGSGILLLIPASEYVYSGVYKPKNCFIWFYSLLSVVYSTLNFDKIILL